MLHVTPSAFTHSFPGTENRDLKLFSVGGNGPFIIHTSFNIQHDYPLKGAIKFGKYYSCVSSGNDLNLNAMDYKN